MNRNRGQLALTLLELEASREHLAQITEQLRAAANINPCAFCPFHPNNTKPLQK